MDNIIINGIKSKERVSKFGEVFTPENIVKDMVNLIPAEVREKLDSTWLEPACGNGNFLVQILSDKLDIAEQLGLENYDINVFKAVCSIYGIDIQNDNIKESIYRMMEIIQHRYKVFTCEELGSKLGDAIAYVLTQNIIWGDALTEKFMRDESELLIPEWTIDGEDVSRKDFTLTSMVEGTMWYGIPTNVYKKVKYTRVMKAKPDEDNVEDLIIDWRYIYGNNN